MLEFLEELVDRHTDGEGVFNKKEFVDSFRSEHSKVVVDKTVFNEKIEEVKQLKEQLDSAADTEDYKAKYEAIKEERRTERKRQGLLELLKDSVDPDFVLSLIENEVEYDEESGELKNAEEILNKRKEAQPYLFKSEVEKPKETKEIKEPKAPKVKDGKLANPSGKPITVESIMAMEDAEEQERLIAANMHLFT